MKSFFCLLMMVFSPTWVFAGPQATQGVPLAGENKSLKALTEKVQEGDRIRGLYQKSIKGELPPSKEVDRLKKTNSKLIKEFRSAAMASDRFARGEIESEAVLNNLMILLQLELLDLRRPPEKQKGRISKSDFSQEVTRLQKITDPWFQFAADLTYNETSLIGLRVAGVVRSLLLDEIERLAPQLQAESNWMNFVNSIRAPWPVDRMLLFESKRILPPQAISVGEKVALSLQQNPYQSVETVLKRQAGGKPKEADQLKLLWKDSDIQAMAREMNRLQLLRARGARAAYSRAFGRDPKSWTELTQTRLLPAVPIDYTSGKGFDFSAIAQ